MSKTDKILEALERLESQNKEREKNLLAQENQIRENLLAEIAEMSRQIDEEFEVDEFKDADLKQLKLLKKGFEKAVNFSRKQYSRASRVDPLQRGSSEGDGISNKDVFDRVVDMTCLSMNLPIRDTVPKEKKEIFDEVNHEIHVELYNRGIRF